MTSQPSVAPARVVRGDADIALAALAFVPETQWLDVGDDLCDCTIQNVRNWTNPYIGKTVKFRFCCFINEVVKEKWPHLVQEIDAYYNENEDRYEIGPAPWNMEDADMPRDLWYRQLSTKLGQSLATIRKRFHLQEPPKRVPVGTGVKMIEGYIGIEKRVGA